MKVTDIPLTPSFECKHYGLHELSLRVIRSRASWTDLPAKSGIYVVYWVIAEAPVFVDNAGYAKYAVCTDAKYLENKWIRINQKTPTDITLVSAKN
ncbi:MAG: hypothetical protein HYR71_12960 [Chloroflexi bacterium]|nr:hypothetical protein [Chloroflexota bacterium]